MIPEKNANIQSKNTLAVPSVAEFYFPAKSEAAIAEAVAWSNARGMPLWVLGGGSNVLLPKKIHGLVVSPAMTGIYITAEADNGFLVEACAGENWEAFVRYCLGRKLYGLENLSIIPGTVGACPIQNVGAYGVEVSDVIHSVKVFNRRSEKVETLSADDCLFKYRQSIFKSREKNTYIVLSVTFRLSTEPKVNIAYPALQSYFKHENTITPEKVAAAVETIRREKIPDPKAVPNVGSFFKNPVIDKNCYLNNNRFGNNAPEHKVSENKIKIPAGWLIDEAGWKGCEKYGVKVHDNQALILTNPKQKPIENVLRLADDIQSDIFNKYGISLEIEPEILCQI